MSRFSHFMGALLALSWIAPTAVAAQQPASIRGRITDNTTQQPLSGVTVAAGGRVVLTQPDGRYVLSVPAGTATVRVRMVGYAPATQDVAVAAGESTTLDVALAPQAINLAEIVVTGYGEQHAGNITGAVTQVSAEKFNPGRVISPELLIQNKIPGVQVVESNEPGGGVTIRTRGAATVESGNDPLYVIDGIPVGIAQGAGGGLSAGRNALNFLNPSDIETITVLRDASAAAIYGANAASGVVIIETKGGRGRPQVEYQGSTSASSVTRLPQMLDAAQFRTAVMTYGDTSQQNQLQNATTNWFDLVGQTAFGQEHNVAVANATDRTDWRLSVGYLNQRGVLRSSAVERMSLGLSLTQRMFNDRLEVRTNLRGSRVFDRFTPGGVLSNAAQMGPTQPVLDPNAPSGYYDWPGNRLTSADNPVAILALATDRGTTYRSIGNAAASYRVPFLQGLRANLNLAYDVTRTDRLTFTPSILHSQTKTGNDGSDYRANQSQTNTSLEAYGNYTVPRSVGPGTMELTAGYSFAQSSGDYPWYLASGLSTDVLGGNGVTTARTVQNFRDIQESRLISFFGRANYNVNDRYLAALSVRRDGSSRFGPANQWGTFPSLSLGWRISEESFLKNVGSLSDLKLRAAWGGTGNQAIPNYQQYARYLLGDAQTQAQFGPDFIPTIRPSPYNPSIKWESTRSFDLGVDFGFMKQRVSGSLDWYDKETRDLVFFAPVPAGFTIGNATWRNIGTMRNRGVELSLNTRLREAPSGGLRWTADFTASHNSNEMLTIYPSEGTTRVLTGLVAGGVGTYIQVLQPGQPINSFYVYHHIRGADGRPIYQDRTGLTNNKFNGTPDGTINEQDLYVDLNGDSVINQDDRRPFHDPAPKWIFGHSSYFGYGNFELNFTLRAYLGNYVYNNVASNLGTYSEVTRGSPYNLHASVLETGFETPQYLSDFYVEDASFLRMDNITLAYSFMYQGQPLRAFGTIQNAFTLTGYSGVDPTAGLNGLDNNIYPRSRTFTAGLSVRF
ncbi:MAG TPA: SusC/RagA family TonB-linked outer membrane protein [Gemmatimonadales bacterium]|jgi:iron complex outermembrane receptor protein|nr:SusC/RagA family TonB-linked outer membrane protein [Gemmatimonadales bacterium]